MEDDKNDDFIKMFKKASEMSKLFNNNNDEKKVNNENNFDMEHMFKIIKVMNIIKEINKQEKINKENDYKGSLEQPIYFDEDLSTPAMKTIKSALPYVDYKYQKNIGIIIKFMEIQNLLSKYNDALLAMKKKDDKNWHKNMLIAIRPHMKKEKKEIIDKLIKFIDLKDIFLKLNDTKLF